MDDTMTGQPVHLLRDSYITACGMEAAALHVAAVRDQITCRACRKTVVFRCAEAWGERERLAAALAPFGFECTDQFWHRYHNDPWVFHLANAVEQQAEQIARLQGGQQL